MLKTRFVFFHFLRGQSDEYNMSGQMLEREREKLDVLYY